jgi:hypothetical protein
VHKLLATDTVLPNCAVLLQGTSTPSTMNHLLRGTRNGRTTVPKQWTIRKMYSILVHVEVPLKIKEDRGFRWNQIEQFEHLRTTHTAEVEYVTNRI